VKKIYSVVLALVVLMTPYVQAKTCFYNQCDYITDGGFTYGSTYWQTGGGNGVTFPNDTSCYGSKVAHLDNTEWISQSFYVDDTYTGGFDLQLRIYHLNDTDNWYDQLRITVTNTDTNVSEVFYVRGSSYTTSCGLNVFHLSNDYSNAHVTVKFDVAYLALGQFELDDVGFWGTF